MTAIAIFVKTPGLTPVKTRLGASVGQRAAAALYLKCAWLVAASAERAGVGPVYWAIAESADSAGVHWPGHPVIEQGEGGLGARMARILGLLVERHGSGLLLGADAPQIDAAELRRAGTWLDATAARRVIGPARDGGFWTFGANDIIPESRWTQVEYSRPDTLRKFREAIGDEAEWLELPVLTDLDEHSDLIPVARELERLRANGGEWRKRLAADLVEAAKKSAET